MSEITISLNKLHVSRANARKTNAAEGLDELAASIAAHGLLQALVVRKASRGKFAVIAGQRRYLALSRLAEGGQVTMDHDVPCRLVSAEADATEISLAENVVRLAMHPADQFEAFRKLIDEGATAPDIAARFGVSESIVVKRMKLGRVSPALLDVYRSGGMSLEQLQAFTIGDDHAAQERVWAELPPHGRSGQAIRQALTTGEIPSTHKRVGFVTVDGYEAAGGTVRRDLFDGHNAGYIADTSLLDRLVQEKLAKALSGLTGEGWKWIETHPDFDWQQRSEFTQAYPTAVPLPQAEAEELDALEDEAQALYEMIEDGSADEQASDRLAAIEVRTSQLRELREAFTEEQRAIAGVVVSLRHEGTVIFDRGLVRREDVPSVEPVKTPEAEQRPKSPMLPASLIETLTQHKTAALQAELAQQPDIALAAVVHVLALSAFYRYGADSCLAIRSLSTELGDARESKAGEAMTTARDRWGDHLPGEAGALWAWCLSQDRERLLDLLALTVAQSIDAIQRKGQGYSEQLRHSGELAAALKLDMAQWFTPTADNYFAKIGKTLILDAIAEARGAPNALAWPKLKKAELAAIAEQHTAGTGWLPEPLRIPAPGELSTASLPPWAD